MSPTVLPRLHSRTHRPFISTLPRRRIPPPHPHPLPPLTPPPPPPASRALSLQAVDIPAETARLVRCHNPWPNEEELPTFVSGVPALTSGSEVWVAIHNHRPEPLRLHTGQSVGTLEIVAIADSPPPPTASSPHHPPLFPAHLLPTQQQQLKALWNPATLLARGRTIWAVPRCSSTP